MKKIAVLSDIHSNVWALEAILLDAKRKGVDGLINLGDILYGPLAPRETYDLLQTEEVITIRGNQDRQIYQATESEISSNPTMQFILSELGKEPLQWMRGLPEAKSLDNDVFICHGTPDNDLVYMLEDVAQGYARVRSDTEILGLLAGVKESLILCGHTHIPRSVQLSNGQLVVNPGSVGLPAYFDDEPIPHKMENYSNLASYCIVESTSSGWQVEHMRIPYKYENAVQAAKQRNRLDWAIALESGRAVI
ncbi:MULTISPECIES: metallophosphoesterase family protein [unclassified Endozoicomonas]|uniref:metallophosphoesterase family protein n=1 Tax=unclassified Endozoicomonas TaxID=2644528 RepID=UPI003BB63E36